MNFSQYLGKYVCGNLSEMEYPKLAIAGIIEGVESKYLGILAGMYRTDETSELRKYLKRTIEELNIELPNKRDAALLYSSGILDEILSGKKDLIKGIKEIENSALNSYDFRAETNKYLYDSIGFERAYGLYDGYIDLMDSLQTKTIKKEMEELEIELSAEIKKWRLKLKNGV